jgi:hypothetical protein
MSFSEHLDYPDSFYPTMMGCSLLKNAINKPQEKNGDA